LRLTTRNRNLQLSIATYNSRSRLITLAFAPALGALVRGNTDRAASFNMADEVEEVCIFPMILVCICYMIGFKKE